METEIFGKLFGAALIITGLCLLFFRKFIIVAFVVPPDDMTLRSLQSKGLFTFMFAFTGVIMTIVGITIFITKPTASQKGIGLFLVLLAMVFIRYCRTLGVWYLGFSEKWRRNNSIERGLKITVPATGVALIIVGALLMLFGF